MIVVHHLNHSRSHRVLWLLEELGVDYEVRRYERDPATLKAPPALASVHPLGKAPTIVDDGRVLAESGAILEVLADRYGPGRLAPGPGTLARERYAYWMHYAEGSAMLPLVLRLIFQQMPKQPMPALARPVVRALAKNVIDTFVQPQIDQHLDHMERELGATTCVAGGILRSDRKKLWSWVERIRTRPAYARAVAKGGPYDLKNLG